MEVVPALARRGAVANVMIDSYTGEVELSIIRETTERNLCHLTYK